MFPNSICHWISFSLASSAHVSVINTTKGSFAWIMTPISFLVHRFPNPWQFQTMKLIWIGEAAWQALPLKCHVLQPLKPVLPSLVTRVDLLFPGLLFFFWPLVLFVNTVSYIGESIDMMSRANFFHLRRFGMSVGWSSHAGISIGLPESKFGSSKFPLSSPT